MAHKMVLCYNSADPDESFVTMLSEEDLAEAKSTQTCWSQELYDEAKANRIEMPSVCCYA